MVLENSSADDGGFIDSSVPQSDSDTYDSNAINAATNQPLPANLPRSPFLSEKKLRIYITIAQRERASQVQRPLTKEEADFWAFWTAKLHVIHSYGIPVGTIGGAWRAYDTRATYKFPFMSKSFNKLNPDVFPSRMMPFLTGQIARTSWHMLRTSIYVAMGMTIGDVLFAGYALSVCGVGTVTDPRAKQYYEDVAVIRQGKQAHGRQPVPGPMQRPQQESTAENPPDGYQEPFPAGGFDAQFEEATPTSGGSAWDRLRQQAKSGKAPVSKTGPSAGSRVDDTSAGSENGEDVLSEREKAQREFDLQIERERHGGSFDSGSGDTKRW